MSYKQQGYSAAGRVARKSDKDITGLQEIRAHKLRGVGAVGGNPARFTATGTSREGSAAGIPGYYSSQRGPAVTKNMYRKLAALGSKPGGFADTDKEAFYAAQGVPYDANDEAAAIAQAPLKWDDRHQLQGFGVKLERDDVEFLEQKRAEQLQVEFDQWLVRRINLDDPANSRWVQEIYPEFYERRERFIDDKINLEAALSKIRLRGVKDRKDLQLLFAINSGLVQPSTVPLFSSGGPAAGRDYQQGMMSVLQWFAPRGSGPSNGTDTQGAFARPDSILGKTGGNIV